MRSAQPRAARRPVRLRCRAAAAAALERAKARAAQRKDSTRARSPRRTRRARARCCRKPEIVELFSRLRELNPKPTTELEFTTPFELLVAVVLSAQATDVGVNKATRKLFPVANTPAAIAKLGEEKLKRYIATIGLFNTKAANVIALSQRLLDEHGGQVPRDREALEALPGVGRKTANVVLNTAFGEPTMAVDTHIFRVVQPHRPGAGQGRARSRRQSDARACRPNSCTTPTTG